MEKNITIIGIGKIGMCVGLVLEKNGYNVLGVDINKNLVDGINNKTLKSYEPKVNDYLNESKNFRATTNLSEGLNHSNTIFIIIRTPNSGGDRLYDHTPLSNLLYTLNEMNIKNKTLITCCTVMPGFIDKIGKYMLKNTENVTLNYVPEFIAQGNIIHILENPDMIMIGAENQTSGEYIQKLYESIIQNNPTFHIMKPLEAEVAKMSLNGFITTKISYANNISEVCDKLNINSKVVMKAIGSDKRIGNKYFNPGLSYGGPCFPRDTEALQLFLNNNGVSSKLIGAVREFNDEHIKFCAEKLIQEGKDEYVIENVCFKDDCELVFIEESPKLKIALYLVKKGYKVIIKDKEEVLKEVKKEYGNIFKYE